MAESPAATNALAPYANVRILVFDNQLPGVLDSPRSGCFVFEGFIKRQREVFGRVNPPGIEAGDFITEGYLTRGALLPVTPSQPWDWLAAEISWSTGGIRPISATTPALLAPCFGVVWLGPLGELTSPGALPVPSRGQCAAFLVSEFGGLHGAGGIGALTQPLLGERHLTTVATLSSLNPTITARPSDALPLGSWLFIPKRRAAVNAARSSSARPASFYTPETLATYLGVSTSTIYRWNASGYGPPVRKLGNRIRYSHENVRLWLTGRPERG